MYRFNTIRSRVEYADAMAHDRQIIEDFIIATGETCTLGDLMEAAFESVGSTSMIT
jgi:GDP-D-mannose dehydratase